MGLIGGGGGGLYVIVLMAFLKLDVRTAVGTALILSTVTLASASWQYGRRKLVRWDHVLAISIPGLVGVLCGTLATRFINDTVLKIAIVAVFVVSGASSLLKVGSRELGPEGVRPALRRLPALIPMGLVGGVITGSLGLSGAVPMGSLLVAPLLVAIFGAGSVLGTFGGVRLAVRVNRKVLAAIMGVLTIGSGIYLVLK
jgi:uncharacterized membrane protein YfcA